MIAIRPIIFQFNFYESSYCSKDKWKVLVDTHKPFEECLNTLWTLRKTLDINLQKSNSYEIAEKLTQNGIPVVFLSDETGVDRPETIVDAKIVTKPIDFNQLVKVLKDMLE